jgi:pimeloyl-ACP methyl ester carboxylesterase
MKEYDAGTSNPFTVESMADYKALAELMFFHMPHVPYALARAGYLNTHRLKDELPRMQKEFLQHSTPMEELAAQLSMPVLIEWGEEDRATHPDGARVLQEILPEATVVMHPECGHLPMLECPTLSAQTFLDFAVKHKLGP